jgi:hypothetical protein
MKSPKAFARRSLLPIMLVLLPKVAFAKPDLILSCEGTSREVGTGHESSVYYELEFFWTAGAYRQYVYPDDVRTLKSEGPASEDDNSIYWGASDDKSVIDRKTGGMVNKYIWHGKHIIETWTCTPMQLKRQF